MNQNVYWAVLIGLFCMFFFRDRKFAGGVSQTDHTGCLNLVTEHLYLMGLFLFRRYLFKSSHCIFFISIPTKLCWGGERIFLHEQNNLWYFKLWYFKYLKFRVLYQQNLSQGASTQKCTGTGEKSGRWNLFKSHQDIIFQNVMILQRL